MAQDSKLTSPEEFEFLGEMQLCPIGEDLYSDHGNFDLKIFYMSTKFGHPWIILGTARSRKEFMTELENDDELQSLGPISSLKEVVATLIVEKDFGL